MGKADTIDTEEKVQEGRKAQKGKQDFGNQAVRKGAKCKTCKHPEVGTIKQTPPE